MRQKRLSVHDVADCSGMSRTTLQVAAQPAVHMAG
jgi:hypothetical protein